MLLLNAKHQFILILTKDAIMRIYILVKYYADANEFQIVRAYSNGDVAEEHLYLLEKAINKLSPNNNKYENADWLTIICDIDEDFVFDLIRTQPMYSIQEVDLK